MSTTSVPGPTRADAAQRQLRLLVAREQPRREPVAPLDLAEERLAVLGVADGARRDEQRPLGAERLELAAVVGERRCGRGRSGAGRRRRRASTPSPSRVIACRRTTSSTLAVRRRRRAAGSCSSRGRPRRLSLARHDAGHPPTAARTSASADVNTFNRARELCRPPSGYIFTWLVGYSSLLGPIGGIMIADYYFIRRQQLNTKELYQHKGEYSFTNGFNSKAIVALLLGILPRRARLLNDY